MTLIFPRLARWIGRVARWFQDQVDGYFEAEYVREDEGWL